MRKMQFLAMLMLAMTATSAHAMDHRSQFGVGAGLGGNFAAPWSNEEFRKLVGAKVPAGGVWARYIPGTPEVGLELSYNYLALSKMDFSAHTFILEFISRQNPWGSFHPFYGIGFGYARTNNKFAAGEAGKWDDPIAKLTAGIEFEMDDRTDIGLRLDHYTIFRDTNTQYSMHMISPVVTINHYFGTPAPLPAAPAPAPTPTAAAPAAPTTPAVIAPSTPSPAPEAHKAAPAKKAPARSQQSAKKKKKFPKDKKKKKTPGTGSTGGEDSPH